MSGEVIALGGGLLKTWATRQAVVALSRGGDGGQNGGLGWTVRPHLLGDASAARAMTSPQGIGHVSHLDVRLLWPQHTARSGTLQSSKVWGHVTTSGTITTPMSHADSRRAWGSVAIR